MWTVGVARSGNEMGLSEEEEAALLAQKPEEHKVRLGKAKERFVQVGANFVIDSVAELMPVIEKINALVKQGKTPFSQ
jgi:phosphonoacetaldehyde hydrolase